MISVSAPAMSSASSSTSALKSVLPTMASVNLIISRAMSTSAPSRQRAV
jgi:hypothetical protein